jgi:effector-binding domain-containing protein
MDNLSFTTEDVPAIRLLAARTVAPQSQIGEAIGRVMGTLFGAVGPQVKGAPVCVFPEPFDPEHVVAEPGVPFDGEPPYGFVIRELPASRALVGHVTGPYEQLPDAWQATMAHLQEQGLQMAGVPYERYVGDDEAEIVIPLN